MKAQVGDPAAGLDHAMDVDLVQQTRRQRPLRRGSTVKSCRTLPGLSQAWLCGPAAASVVTADRLRIQGASTGFLEAGVDAGEGLGGCLEVLQISCAPGGGAGTAGRGPVVLGGVLGGRLEQLFRVG